jgi:hypothetical protein
MNELVKALKNFIVRDIIYITGGACVMLSFLHLFYKINDVFSKDTHIAIYLLLAGIAYAIGYCIQDTASWIKIVTTANVKNPPKFIESLYKRFTGEDKWENAKQDNNAELIIQERSCQDVKVDRERIISLMQVGTTIGPCSIVSGLLLFCKVALNLLKMVQIFFQNFSVLDGVIIAVIIVVSFLAVFAFFRLLTLLMSFILLSLVFSTKTLGFDLSLAYAATLIGICLIILGWLKAMQLTKNTKTLQNFYKDFCTKPECPLEKVCKKLANS